MLCNGGTLEINKKAVLAKVESARMDKKTTIKRMLINAVILLFTSIILAVFMLLGSEYLSTFFKGESLLRLLYIAIIAFFTLSTIMMYMYYTKAQSKMNKKMMPVICLATIITYGLSIVFSATISVYVAPLLLMGLLVATLVDKRTGIMVSVLMGLVYFLTYAIIMQDSNIIEGASLLTTTIISAVIIIINYDKANTRFKFVVLTTVVGIFSALATILICSLVPEGTFVESLICGMWSFVACVISLALYELLLPIFEWLFKIDTNYRLAEICSFKFKLLKKLAEEAPGTFNHSLIVGNLSELCAGAIGEDALLAKACAYYHDIGKIKNPESFVENQTGYNPHDDLIPEVSIKMITSHTEDGYNIIKEARLPDVIADVAREHHGTTAVSYFLYKAQNLTEDELSASKYSYKDPKPSTKIAAIVMIVDTVEAASRAVAADMTSRDSYRTFIKKLIQDKKNQDQFSNCDITFKDLQIIEDVLVETVPNMYHARIKYNNKKG